jgi:hypothetical protein
MSFSEGESTCLISNSRLFSKFAVEQRKVKQYIKEGNTTMQDELVCGFDRGRVRKGINI